MKARITYILAMILMIPFFVLVVLTIGSQGNGKEIMNGLQTMTVIKEEGELETVEAMPLNLAIEKDGNYNLSYSWNVEEPGFLTSITVKDSEGNCVYSDSGFQVNDASESVFLKKGDYEVNWEFFANEKDFRQFNEENSTITNQTELENYIEDIAFDTFPKDSKAPISLSASVHKPYTAPLWIKILCFVTGLILIASCVLTYVFDMKNDKNISEGVDNISLIYTIFSIIVIAVQLILSVASNYLPIEYTPNVTAIFTFALIVISVDVIGFPLVLGLTKKMPKREIPKEKFGFFKFIPYMFMTAGLMIAGMIIGTLVHNLFTLPFGASNTSGIAQLLIGSSAIPRILVVGILAPIFEELIFRKVLVDRLSKYGSFIAIVVSGLFFGLFHGNFSQFFFATMIGCLFAFLYLKTGKVYLTIILHMMVNLTTSGITTTLLQKVYEKNPSMNTSPDFISAHPDAFIPLALFGFTLLALALIGLIGIIILIVFAATKKFTLPKIEGEPTKAEAMKALFTSKYAWLFIISGVGLFLISYLPGILGM